LSTEGTAERDLSLGVADSTTLSPAEASWCSSRARLRQLFLLSVERLQTAGIGKIYIAAAPTRWAAGRCTSSASVSTPGSTPRAVSLAHQLGELGRRQAPPTELFEAAQQLKVDAFIVRLRSWPPSSGPAGPVLARESGRARGAGPRSAGPKRKRAPIRPAPS